MKSFKAFLKEDIFIGHKLKLQELQKTAKKDSDYLKYITKAFKENSDIGEYGQFCKDYPEYVPLYWYCGGRKLQPTKRDCEDLIRKVYEIKKPIDSLSSDEKWDLFNKGTYVSESVESFKEYPNKQFLKEAFKRNYNFKHGQKLIMNTDFGDPSIKSINDHDPRFNTEVIWQTRYDNMNGWVKSTNNSYHMSKIDDYRDGEKVPMNNLLSIDDYEKWKKSLK